MAACLIQGAVLAFAATAALASSVTAAVGDPAAPNHWSQLLCVRDRGACLTGPVSDRDAGIPNDDEISGYDQACRVSSRYSGPAITLSEVSAICAVPTDWNERNQALAIRIRAESKGNDLEALARLFEDTRLISSPSVADRLDVILTTLENPEVPAARTGLKYQDEGFAAKYKDPHVESNDQVGHFMTAVGLAYDSGVVLRGKLGISIRELLSVPLSMSNDEVALRLIVGHEKAPDPAEDANPVTKFLGFRKQFYSATSSDLSAFMDADASQDHSAVLNIAVAEPLLRSIPIQAEWSGNSYQDIRLSLAGYRLGKLIREGAFRHPREIATWLRKYIGERP